MSKGGGAKQYNALEPKLGVVGEIEGKLGDIFNGSLSSFNADDWAKRLSNAQQRGDNAAAQQDAILGQLPALFNRNNEITGKMLDVIDTGNIPSALTDAMNKSVNNALQSGMGSMLSGLGSRGVLNSSITSKGINNLAGNAANAFNQNYLNAFNSVLNGYSSALTGNQGNVTSAISGANAYGAIPSQAYEQAYAPITGAYNFWKDAETIRHSNQAYDTVVKQGK